MESVGVLIVGVGSGLALMHVPCINARPDPESAHFSQALTLAAFAFTQTAAALSGFIFLPAMRLETVFWSADVQLNFLINGIAGKKMKRSEERRVGKECRSRWS